MIISKRTPKFRVPSLGTSRAPTKWLLAGAIMCTVALPAFLRAGATASAQQAAPQTAAATAPNSDPVYQQLRNITPGGKTITVKDFVLKRDAGTFTFKSGNFFFLTPVQGKTTGAVFIGTATFSLNPSLEAEKHSLNLLTKSSEMVEEFSRAVFRFTDGTEEDIEAKGSAPTEMTISQAGELLADIQQTLRKHRHYNLDARILQDVLSTEPGDFFCAFIKGQKYSGKEIYVMDRHGVPADFIGVNVAPEEVAFYTYDDNKFGVWTASHYLDEYTQGTASGRQVNESFRIVNQKLDVTIEKNGRLTGTATTTILPLAQGMRVLPLRLFYKLRVETVMDENQQPLSFIQEKKDEDYQFSVILPNPLTAGSRFTFTTTYSGPDAVINLGFGSFYPVARTSWYPSSYSTGNYATYEVTFRIPKGLTMVATGSQLAEGTEGEFEVSQWRTDIPIPEAGFNFGQFKKNEIELPDQGVTLENYANVDLATSTTKKMKRTLGEGQLAIPLYTDYFGPIPYKRLGITEQAAYYGQSFASLIFLPIISYSDPGAGGNASAFFRAVGPHEIAHQWWGNTVGWISYRDQWMGEGFAEFSASLFLQTFFKDGTYDKFWEMDHKLLVEKDKEGFRAIDVGPVTLGYRLASTRAGFSTPRRLIYPKGAYILNMIRMMMWSSDTQDADFKKLMHDFVQFYTNRPATTEDFKLAVEQHMNPSMNLTGDGKMDWFFDEYVYGTALPSEKFSYTFSNGPDGSVALNFKVEQSGVGDHFRMLIPVYLELAEGGIFRVGSVPLTGNTTFENQIVLRGLKTKPKRAMINYYHDMLCNQN
jgi:hypothetical protein